MSNKMTDTLIQSFISEVEHINAVFERISFKKNHVNRKQSILTNVLDIELTKYKKTGFAFSYCEEGIVIPCFTEENDDFDFSVRSLNIEFKERNIKYSFMSHVNRNGSISYEYYRI